MHAHNKRRNESKGHAYAYESGDDGSITYWTAARRRRGGQAEEGTPAVIRGERERASSSGSSSGRTPPSIFAVAFETKRRAAPGAVLRS